MMKTLSVLLFLISSIPAFAADMLAARLAGQWRGVGVQNDNQDWAVRLDLGASGASVDYPGIPCGGAWVFSQDPSASQKDRTIATEILSYGKNLCIDESQVILTPYPEGQLLIVWKNPDDSDLALAVLHLAGTRPPQFKAEWAETMWAWRNR